MFRKIISNLPFSPALVGQLGLYAKRLKKEEFTRKLGLIFFILALTIQSIAIFQPPEPSNSSNPNDMVNGGIGDSFDIFLKSYDSNANNLKDIMNFAGITRNEISNAKYTSWKVDNTKIIWGLKPQLGYSNGERQYNIKQDENNITNIYSRPLNLWANDNSDILGWVGSSSKAGWFGIMQKNGNLVTEKLLATQTQCENNKKDCDLCSGEVSTSSDITCIPNIKKSKTATNITQGFTKANSTKLSAGDQISYTLTVENTDKSPISITLEDNLSDILEYGTVIDSGGGSLDRKTNILSWSNVELSPNSKQTRAFVVKISDNIPSTAQGVSNPFSYDCNIDNDFGDFISLNIDCPTPKIIESYVKELPKINPSQNIVIATIMLFVITYFYARTKQIKKEIKIIRQDITNGTI